MLLGGSSYDELVPESGQLKAMRSYATTLLLQGCVTPAGSRLNFTHASVTPAALKRWHRAVRRMLTGTHD